MPLLWRNSVHIVGIVQVKDEGIERCLADTVWIKKKKSELKDVSLEKDCFIVSTVNVVLEKCNLPRALWNVTTKCFI